MLATVLTHELREGIEAFLRSTFPTATPAFRGAFDGAGRGKLFWESWLRIGLPFHSEESGWEQDYEQVWAALDGEVKDQKGGEE